jgi:hypothetical protein
VQVKHNKEGGVNADDLELLAEFKQLNYVYANTDYASPTAGAECVVA